MERILPLNEKQLEQLDQHPEPNAEPFRVLANGQAVNIATGLCSSKGSNIIYHPVYWERPKEFIEQVLEFLKENNPTIKFRITYH